MDVDVGTLARDAAEAVRIPSETGSELRVLEWFASRASSLGLEVDLHEHDLEALRSHPSYPGSEAPRTSLWGLTVTLPGSLDGRIALNGHVDVVGPGTVDWRLGPWSGAIEDGRLHGRGSADMKGAVVAAMHALAAVRGEATPTVVLQVVSSEEDGGQGTFAELERDCAFDAALLPEPTDFAVVCAQAGALTFKGLVRGRSAHAATRLEGYSAIDRYVRVHTAFAAHEAAVNASVTHPLMRELRLPYPLLVGRVSGGTWSSQVPDLVEFEGRLGVPVGADLDAARAELQAVVDRALDDGEEPCVLSWEGGAFDSGETAVDDPWVARVRAAVEAERGSSRVVGVPYGADMRLFTARGIPTVMVGTSGLELAHAVDESVAVSELGAVARIIARVLA